MKARSSSVEQCTDGSMTMDVLTVQMGLDSAMKVGRPLQNCSLVFVVVEVDTATELSPTISLVRSDRVNPHKAEYMHVTAGAHMLQDAYGCLETVGV